VISQYDELSASLKYSRISDQQHLYNNIKKKNDISQGNVGGFKEPKMLKAVMPAEEGYKPDMFKSVKINGEHGNLNAVGVNDIDLDLENGKV